MANAPDTTAQNPEALTQINRLRARSLPELEKRERELTEKLKLLKAARAEKAEALKRAEKEATRKRRAQILICAGLILGDFAKNQDNPTAFLSEVISRWETSSLEDAQKIADPKKRAQILRKIARDKELAAKLLEVV